MTIAEDVADWLIVKGLNLSKAAAPPAGSARLFQSEMLDKPDFGVLIVEGAGQATLRSHDLRREKNPGITVIIRAASDGFAAGYLLAHDIEETLLDLTNTTINGRLYKGTIPLGDVADLGKDAADRWKWSVNFLVKL